MPYVYFIHEENNETIFKVGKTELHPADRLAQLQTGNPRKLIIYRWIELADHSTAETYIHEKYKDLNIRNEWFHMTRAMVDEECDIIFMNNRFGGAQVNDNLINMAPRDNQHGRILDENIQLSGRYPTWTDDDRVKVQEARQLKGKYRGKRNPRDVANARVAYYERVIRPQRDDRNNDRNDDNVVPKKLFSDD